MQFEGRRARPLRIEYPGAAYHVRARGNQGRALFKDAPDRLWRSLKFTHLCSDKLTHLVHSTAQCFFFPSSDFAFLVGQAAGVADGPAMLRL